VYTAAINRAWLTPPGPEQEILFMPTWVAITDKRPLDGEGNTPPLIAPHLMQASTAINLFRWGDVASNHPEYPSIPWACSEAGRFETQRLDRVTQYKTTDAYALQLLGGIMGARTFYLVGIDHLIKGKATHSGGEDRLDGPRRHTIPDRHGPHGIGAGFEATKAWMADTGAKVYTCSPWEDSYTREFFEYVPFNEAVAHAHEEMAKQ